MMREFHAHPPAPAIGENDETPDRSRKPRAVTLEHLHQHQVSGGVGELPGTFHAVRKRAESWPLHHKSHLHRRKVHFWERYPLRIEPDQESGLVFLITFVSAIGGFLVGYNLAVVSGALISVGKSIPLDSGKEELIVTIAILAAVVGTLAGGEANNFVGRRPVLIISAILFMFGPLMMACSNSLSILLLGRAVTGIGIGCNAMTTPIYVAEAAPHQLRGALVSCNTLLANLGALAACVCCAIWGGDGVRGGWRVIFGIGALPAIILIIGFLFFLPESPRWLMSEGRVEDAKVVLAQIRGGGDISEELREITMSIEESGQPEKQGRAGFINLFSSAPVRRALALGAIIMLVQQSSGINTLMYYSSSIAEMAGFTDNAAIWSGVGLSFFHTLGVAIGITVVDKFGRRPLMLWSQFLSVLALTALATSFCLSFSHCPKGHWSSFGCICDDVEVTCPPIVYGLLAIVFETIFLFFFGLGMSALPWTVASEIFPLHLRGVGVALCATVNCLGSMVVSSSFLSLAAPTRLNVHGCFALYAFLGLVGWAVLGFLQPETANLTLEEIEALFTRPEDDVIYSDSDIDSDEFLNSYYDVQGADISECERYEAEQANLLGGAHYRAPYGAV